MSDLREFLQEEAEHAEQNKDALPTASTRITRPNRERSRVLSVRLNPQEIDALTAQAELLGIGPSTLARSLILQGLSREVSERDELAVDLNWSSISVTEIVHVVHDVREKLDRLEARVAQQAHP